MITEHIPADIVVQALVAAGLCGRPGTQEARDSGWVATVNQQIDNPTQAITVYSEGGTRDGRYTRGPVVEHPGLQFRVRAEDDPKAYAKIAALGNWADNVLRQVVQFSGVAYTVQAVSRSGPPIRLGLDDTKRRIVYVLNATVTLALKE